MVLPETNFIKKQPQVAQLELLFRGPLVKDSIVDTLNNLIALNVNYNYEHKIVWVKEKQANYYLFDGDGSVISHWKKISGNLIISQYQLNSTFFEGDTVYLNGRIYKALQDIPLLYNPVDYPTYWLLITGEQITYRYIFNEVSSLIFFTDIKNPTFEIIIGTFELDVNDNFVIDTDGLIKINDREIIDAQIIRRQDIANNNGMAYEISFEENSLPVVLTGVINIK